MTGLGFVLVRELVIDMCTEKCNTGVVAIKTLPVTEARKKLTDLVDKAATQLDEYVITVKGRPKAVLMSSEEFESWKETNEILADSELVKAIRKGGKELAEGKGVPWAEAKRELKI